MLAVKRFIFQAFNILSTFWPRTLALSLYRFIALPLYRLVALPQCRLNMPTDLATHYVVFDCEVYPGSTTIFAPSSGEGNCLL